MGMAEGDIKIERAREERGEKTCRRAPPTPLVSLYIDGGFCCFGVKKGLQYSKALAQIFWSSLRSEV